MEKFIVSGVCVNKNIRMKLEMQLSKRFQVRAIMKGEGKLQVQTIINNAVKIHSLDTNHHHVPSHPSTEGEDGQTVELPRSLQHILGKHPFPLCHNPVILPTECKENVKNSGSLIKERTPQKN